MVVVLGWIAAAIGCCITLPQLLRLVRTRSAAGLSLLAWQLTLGTNLAWTMHGVLHHLPNMWLPNALLTVVTLAILSVLHRQFGTSWTRLLVPGLALAAACIALDVVLGPIAFGIAAMIPSSFGWLSQLVALVRSPEITGISLAYLVINVVNQVSWVSWGLLVGEPSVIIASSVIGTLMVGNLCWAMLRRFRVVPALWALAA